MENLCQLLIQQNYSICKSISRGKFDKLELYKYFREAVKSIKKVKKSLKSQPEAKPSGPEVKLLKEVRREQYQNEEYEKLVLRIEKMKQKRQQGIENDKKWSEMNDENEELVNRFNRLKTVVKKPPSNLYLKKTTSKPAYAFLNEPCDEQVKLQKFAFIHELVKTSCDENLPNIDEPVKTRCDKNLPKIKRKSPLVKKRKNSGENLGEVLVS